MSSTISDAGIPLLTEVIPAPAETKRAAIPPPIAVEVVKSEIASLEVRAAAMLEEEEWDRLEREVRERVLVQVIENIDLILEQRVRDSLADVLQTSVERLASEIKSGLRVSVGDMVTRAVTNEITKLKSDKK